MNPLQNTNPSAQAIARTMVAPSRPARLKVCRAPLWCLGLLVVLLLAIGSTATAATLVVTSTADTGAGSLRQAVVSANPGDSISFNLPSPSTIILTSLLIINKNLSVQGPGRDLLTLSAAEDHGVLQVPAGVTVVIGGLRVRSGFASGGGLSNSGTATLSDCSFEANTTVLLGSFGGNQGGGINNEGNLTVSNCIFDSNIAYGIDAQLTGYGGAIANSGTALVERSTFVQNEANLSGGAIYNTGSLTVIESTFSNGNEAKEGGAIYNLATLLVDSSTFHENRAENRGGAINHSAGSAMISNSTLAANVAGSGGGALWNNAPSTIIGSTIAENMAPDGAAVYNWTTLVVSRTLFAFNPCFLIEGTTSQGDNLSFSAVTCVQASEVRNDRIDVNPALLPLADNGGPTMTRMPAAGSPAIDEVRVSACTGLDQRGVSRPQGARCDIGAVESESALIFMSGFES